MPLVEKSPGNYRCPSPNSSSSMAASSGLTTGVSAQGRESVEGVENSMGEDGTEAEIQVECFFELIGNLIIVSCLGTDGVEIICDLVIDLSTGDHTISCRPVD
jgi:hypothetical protein